MRLLELERQCNFQIVCWFELIGNLKITNEYSYNHYRDSLKECFCIIIYFSTFVDRV